MKFLASGLLRRAMILGVLVVGLAFFTTFGNSSQANMAPCCSDCEAREQMCWNLCDWGNPLGDPNCPYKDLQDCYADHHVWQCYAVCTMSC